MIMQANNRNSLQEPEITKILIADDDETTRILLRQALTQWGYQVIEAADGEEAWKILQQPDPPLILTLDWLMPKLDGIGLCKRIETELDYHPYIIFLTRMSGTENVMQGLEAGVDEFIIKPFDLTELRIRIFAGERIIKYRAQLAEKDKQLQDCIANMKSLAAEYAKHIVPFPDLIKILQDADKTLTEIGDNQKTDTTDVQLEKINDLHKKFSNLLQVIKGLTLPQPEEQITPVKKLLKPVSPDEFKEHKTESLINLPRMMEFFGKNITAIQDFTHSFITLSSNHVREIEKSIHHKDTDSAKYYFHLLGSASGNSGIMKIYEVCGTGEEKVTGGDWAEATKCYEELKGLLEQLRSEADNLSKKKQ